MDHTQVLKQHRDEEPMYCEYYGVNDSRTHQEKLLGGVEHYFGPLNLQNENIDNDYKM